MNIEMNKPVKDAKAELHDKVYGSLVGFVVGDAMGATTEFMTKETIRINYGKVTNILGGGWLNLKVGEVTDDTQMMMCIIQAFLDNRKQAINLVRFKKSVADYFVEWYKSNPPDVGNACRAGIMHYVEYGEYMRTNNVAQGNGGLMRALPCYLMGSLAFNYAQNDITHNNDICREFIKAYHETMNKAMNGESFPANSFGTMEPTGRVHNTFYNARFWGMCSDSFEGAILGAVNDGGDADTIAAITGSIAGMRFGFGAIPYRWVDVLDRNLLDKLYEFADMVVERRFNV